jgi:hypothetical protein
MPVAIEMTFSGATLEQYDEVMGLMELEGIPDGALFHWVAETEDGIKVVDVWETREQFDAFAGAKIGPATAQVGVGRPDTTYRDVHNHLSQ